MWKLQITRHDNQRVKTFFYASHEKFSKINILFQTLLDNSLLQGEDIVIFKYNNITMQCLRVCYICCKRAVKKTDNRCKFCISNVKNLLHHKSKIFPKHFNRISIHDHNFPLLRNTFI